MSDENIQLGYVMPNTLQETLDTGDDVAVTPPVQSWKFSDRVLRFVLQCLFRARAMPSVEGKQRLRSARRVLLLRPTPRIGNTVLATSAITLVRSTAPEAEIDVLTFRHNAPLLENLAVNLLTFDRTMFWRPWRLVKLVRQCRRTNYDVAIECGFGSRFGAIFTGLVHADCKIGVEDHRVDCVYHVRLTKPPFETHIEKRWVNLASQLGFHVPNPRTLFRLTLDERSRASAWLAVNGVDTTSETVVGISPAGRLGKGKRWDIANYIELSRQLAASGITTVFLLGPDERNIVDRIRAEAPVSAVLALGIPLREVAAVMGACDLVVAGDSGLLHIACALDRPTIGVFLNGFWSTYGPAPGRGRNFTNATERTPSELVHEVQSLLDEGIRKFKKAAS